MTLSFGFPRMGKERGERRDFLPSIVRRLTDAGCPVAVESGLGGGMGWTDHEYGTTSPLVRIVDGPTAFAQDVVVCLRAPEDRVTWMRPGATLVSMLHFPTRPGRIQHLHELGLEAVSLDSIMDDEGTRLVENMRAVGWNGVGAAFDALASTWPSLTDPARGCVEVMVLGAGSVAKHAVEAATKYGNLTRHEAFLQMNLPGVAVTVLGRNVTGLEAEMCRRLARTDVLVDATQRWDPSRPIVPNEWLGHLPRHAVICDLVVDPYDLEADPPSVRGIEGIPQGDLDQWTFPPDDPAWRRLPPGVPTGCRRTVVSCYSWPGLEPEACMRHYERQLFPLLLTLIRRGGVEGLRANGGMLERALRRATLRSWLPGSAAARTGRPEARVPAA